MTATAPGDPPVAPSRWNRWGGIDAALARYRVMAWTVGVGLVIIVFVGIPLQFAADDKTVVHVVGILHGYLYIVYLFVALDLARRARFSLPQLAAMVGAGLLPFLAFVIERKITAKVRSGDTTPWHFPWQKAPPGSGRP